MQYVRMSIRVKGINKSYGTTQVLHDIHFECAVVKLWCYLASGAGKAHCCVCSIFLKLPITVNCISPINRLISTHPTEQQGLALRRKVGMVFQQYHLWPHMTVLENLVEAP